MVSEVNRILDGENIREVLSDGIEIVGETEIFEMVKLTDELANKAITGVIPGFIYFSPVLDGHGPRIKFYGGTKETGSTKKAPSYTFGVEGPLVLKKQPWMNKSNCPNAYDDKCLEQVRKFIENHLALLLLTWFERLDEALVLSYFEGHYKFADLISRIDATVEQKEKIMQCGSEKELYVVCKELDLYDFD